MPCCPRRIERAWLTLPLRSHGIPQLVACTFLPATREGYMPLMTSRVKATKQHRNQLDIQNGNASSKAARSGVSAVRSNSRKCSVFVTKGSWLDTTSYPYVAPMIPAVEQLYIVKQRRRTNMQYKRHTSYNVKSNPLACRGGSRSAGVPCGSLMVGT